MSRSRAPRKYLDKARTQISPEWREWNERREEAMLEAAHQLLGPGGFDTLFPEGVGKEIPEDGRWIRILEEPHTVLRHSFRLPVMSVWFARPYTLNSGGFVSRGEVMRPQLAKIVTPGGDLCLFPHEYEVWDDPTALVGMEPDVVMHRMDGDLALGEADEEKLFFLMKAGIDRQTATLMLMSGGVDPRYWFEFHPDLVEAYGGIGQPLWRHIALHPRESRETVPA